MVRESNVAQFFKRLKAADRAAVSYPLHIFPSTSDADSLFALKILTSICENDGLRYSCYPVCSLQDIFELAGEKLSSQDEPLAVLLINWGACKDIKRFLKLGPQVLVFVIDSHRPIHLHNLHDDNKNVIVLYTKEDENHSDLAYDFDVSVLANATGTEEFDCDELVENSESDSDEGSDHSDEGERRNKRRKLDENEEKKKREKEKIRTMKALKKLRSQYYRLGNYHGRPAGMLMFDIAHATHKNTNELLWLACASLADQFVHERITSERYLSGVMELEQQVNSAGHLEMVTSVKLKDGTKVRAPDHCRISYGEEPKLILLREWNLYDSLACSSYIATKLKTWGESGIKRIKLLAAQMGIPLTECQQKFRYMSMDSKRRLKEELEKFSSDYGMTDLYYRSFQRHHGYTSQVSATDFVYGITALIESWTEDSEESVAEHFWNAYNALVLNNVEELDTGLRMAINVQKSIFRQGSLAMTKRGFMKSSRGFRWVKVEDLADTQRLCHPQALVRFCYFVMDAMRERGAGTKPVICACVVPNANKLLVVGVAQRPKLGGGHGNQFGVAFRAAAEKIGVECSQFGFEESWMTMGVQSLNAFMQLIANKL